MFLPLLWFRKSRDEIDVKRKAEKEHRNTDDVRIEKEFVRICSQRTGKERAVNRRDFIKYLIDLGKEWLATQRHPLQSTCRQIIRVQQNKNSAISYCSRVSILYRHGITNSRRNVRQATSCLHVIEFCTHIFSLIYLHTRFSLKFTISNKHIYSTVSGTREFFFLK